MRILKISLRWTVVQSIAQSKIITPLLDYVQGESAAEKIGKLCISKPDNVYQIIDWNHINILDRYIV